jgi:ketosteroid isomerase-like protein
MIGRLTCLALLVAAACGLAPARPPQITKAEEEVMRLERQWLDAYEQNDAEAMNRIVADDFTITFPNGGMQTKPQIMAMVKSPRRASRPRMRFRTEGVRRHGDTHRDCRHGVRARGEDGLGDVEVHGHIRAEGRALAGRGLAPLERPGGEEALSREAW